MPTGPPPGPPNNPPQGSRNRYAARMNPASPSKPSVLVYDRAQLVAETIATVLEFEGYVTHPTVTYREAKKRLKDLPDLSLMIIHADHRPGERRGGALLQSALRERPGTAIVIVSSRLPQDLGPFPPAAVFLEKPFDRAALLSAIEQARTVRPTP
ncbi:hypothetical protein SAMN02800694_2894 [Luteibacter sp. UNCMF331Sha3.1]|nr:hypothetical protein SAMN02800694_2894 [Luteibacter sp. UNCMF331Sha3.1]